jgi:hypothetical protein
MTRRAVLPALIIQEKPKEINPQIPPIKEYNPTPSILRMGYPQKAKKSKKRKYI